MTKQIFLLLSISFVLNPVISQCTLYKLGLYEKIVNSQIVAEGRVVQQTAFAAGKDRGYRIYTANVVELYKVFKGNAASRVVIITPGGQLGDTYLSVEPSLKLRKGQVGMFFGKTSSIDVNSNEAYQELDLYEPYGSLQGFIQYDEWLGKGADIFHKYENIERDLYSSIVQEVGKRPMELSAYSLMNRQTLSRMAPQIDSVNTDTISAGTHTLLEIYGSNFEAYDAGTNSVVSFREADMGGETFIPCPAGEIVSWTDTFISLYLPTEAGSGNFSVQNASLLTTESTINLNVPFSALNVESTNTPDQFRRIVLLKDDNDVGGYDLTFSTNTADGGVSFAGSAAQGSFELAASNWCGNGGANGTGFNLTVGAATTTVNTDGNDALNVIMFDNDLDPLPAGVLGRTHNHYVSCDGGNVWYLDDFDIRFRRDGTDGITWNFGPGGTDPCCYDFLSVAIHELGHAHLLGHSIGANNVMNSSLTNGEDVRTIDMDTDNLGGSYILTESEFLNTCDGAVVGMIPCTPISPLPLEFIEFRGEPQNLYNQLTWTVSETIDQSGFQIDRSANGKEFHQIGMVKIDRRVEESQSFIFDDRQLEEDAYFYRLTSIDLTGSIKQSEIIEISNPLSQRVVSVYPNPTNNEVNVFIGNQNNRNSETAIIHLVDMQGRTLYQGTETTGRTHTISLANLSSGVYVIRLNIPSENSPLFKRIVKN